MFKVSEGFELFQVSEVVCVFDVIEMIGSVWANYLFNLSIS